MKDIIAAMQYINNNENENESNNQWNQKIIRVMQKIKLIKNKDCSDEKNVNSFNNSIYNTNYKVFSSLFSS